MSVALAKISDNNCDIKTKKAQKGAKKQNRAKFNLPQMLTQPVKDSFHKKYGDDVKPTPKLIADFAADKVLTVAVVGLGTLAAFKKMKGATNGLTKAFAEAKDANGMKKAGKVVADTIKQVKSNNQAYAQTVKKDGATILKSLSDENTSIVDGLKGTAKNIFRSKESFDAESKLGKGITKIFGSKNATGIQNGLKNAGIANGYDLVDTTLAVGATAMASKGLGTASKEVTEADDEKLANQSKLKAVVKKASDVADFVIEFDKKMNTLGE